MNILSVFRMYGVVKRPYYGDIKSTLFVMKASQELDARMEEFKAASGIECVKGCGACCAQGAFHVTMLEVMPLAFDLWMRNRAGCYRDKIKASGRYPKVCVFFEADLDEPGKGRCSVYRWRPISCRLYGFSAGRDSRKQMVFDTCAKIKEAYSAEFDRVRREVAGGMSVPVADEVTDKISGFCPGVGAKKFNINEAILAAINRVEFIMRQSGVVVSRRRR